MKSKKKLLLLGVGAMGALALGVGATSTFAWYVADSYAGALVQDVTSGNITTVNEAQATSLDIALTVTWDVSQTINLSDDNGVNKVWYNGAAVPSNNSDTLDKVALGKITFTKAVKKNNGSGAYTADLVADDYTALNGQVFNVYVTASDQIRVGNDSDVTGTKPDKTTKKTSGYVGAYTHADPSATPDPIEAEKVLLGKITLTTSTSAITKIAVSNQTVAGATETDDILYFFYSVSPKTESNSEAYNAATSYGTVTAVIEA